MLPRVYFKYPILPPPPLSIFYMSATDRRFDGELRTYPPQSVYKIKSASASASVRLKRTYASAVLPVTRNADDLDPKLDMTTGAGGKNAASPDCTSADIA